MLNTATRTMIDSTTNIATRSTWSASNKAEFIERQSLTTARLPTDGGRAAPGSPGPGRRSTVVDLDHADRIAHHQEVLRLLDRHDHERLVEIVEADLEDRGDAIVDDPRHRPERRRPALRAR